MKVEHLFKDKKGMTIPCVKPMVSFFIIIVLILPIIPVQAEIYKDHDHPEVSWKHYPYQPPGTEIIFPTDEGSHETSTFPIEWWYANFHLTGQTTGREYGSFIAFYKIESSIAEKKEVRIFSISDIASEKTYTNVQIGALTASPDHLDLSFEYITNDDAVDKQTVSNPETESIFSQNQERMNTENSETARKSKNQTIVDAPYDDIIQKSNPINNPEVDYQESSDGYIQYDHWYTNYNDQGLLPFQYSLDVNGNSQQDEQPMKLIVDMDCQKQPLIVGGDGYINYEYDDFSYYYSLTRLNVAGTISVHGFTEVVSGNAWIDHQWGNFINQNPPPLGLTMTYEWFSIQLDYNREIEVGDMWDRETGEKMAQSFTDGLDLVNSDGSLELLNDYMITPLAFWNDSADEHFYSCQWHLIETSKSIDLVVTPVFLNQIIRFEENYQILQQVLEELFPSACFWEGVCTVTGTINDIHVNGKAYVELTHYYKNAEK